MQPPILADGFATRQEMPRRLTPLDGLEAIAADLIGQRLHVKYDAAKLTTFAMVDVVGQAGMRMWPRCNWGGFASCGAMARVAYPGDSRVIARGIQAFRFEKKFL